MEVAALLVVVVSVAVLLLSYLCWKVSRSPGASCLPRGCKLPPVEGGWVPWVGCAVAFGKEPLWYIKKTHEKVNTHSKA